MLARQTLRSLRKSAQITLEKKVLLPDHACLNDGCSLEHREAYKFPNGSQIDLMGLENVDTTFSTEYDIVAVVELHQVSLDSWEKLGRCVRNGVLPWQQRIGETNPAHHGHWANQHFPKPNTFGAEASWKGRKLRACSGELLLPNGKSVKTWRTRLLSRHEDNPSISAQYLATLQALTGARRARLYEGLWVSAEGRIWECFDPLVHILDGELTNEGGVWKLGDRVFTWFVAGVDWGFRAPGTIGVWGVTSEHEMVLVHEVYRREMTLDWWAEKFQELYQRYQIRVAVCDPSRPDAILAFNRRIGAMGGRDVPGVARPAVNRHHAEKDLGGLDLVRWGLEQKRILFWRHALESECPLQKEAMKPVCATDEIEGYVWAVVKDGQPVREMPAPDLDDHGCDEIRYVAEEAIYLDRSTPEQAKGYAPGTFGAVMEHEKFLRKLRQREFGIEEEDD